MSGHHTWTTIAGAVTGSMLASACCIGPVIVAGLGIGSAGFASALAPYRPYFLGLTVALLGAAFVMTYRRRPRGRCTADGTCETAGPSRRAQGLLWSVTVVVLGIASYPYWGLLGPGTSARATPTPSPTHTRVLEVTGMTCGSCAAHVQHALESVPGVAHAVVDYEAGTAAVELRGEVTDGTLRNAIRALGYDAAPVAAAAPSGTAASPGSR